MLARENQMPAVWKTLGTASAANSLQPADFKRAKALSKVAIVADLLSNRGINPKKRHYPDNLQ